MNKQEINILSPGRLFPLDLLRGAIMVLLMFSSTGVFDYLYDDTRRLNFVTIVGMHAIFIYLFFEIEGSRWFNGFIAAPAGGVLKWFNADEFRKVVVSAACIFTIEWWLCYLLCNEKYFSNSN